MMGVGISMITKSVSRSVAVNTVSMSNVLEHCVRKMPMGAQFNFQLVPHWKTVAPKKASVHKVTITIMVRHAIRNARSDPRILSQRKRRDSLMIPKVIFSVLWNPYLYFCTKCSRSVETGQSLTTGECPVMAPCTVPEIKTAFRARTKI